MSSNIYGQSTKESYRTDIEDSRKQKTLYKNYEYFDDYSYGNSTKMGMWVKKNKDKYSVVFFQENGPQTVETLKKFKGLKYRQEIIFHSKKLTIINDSKATTLSSSASILKSITNVQWIVGGQAKKGDKLLLSKKDCKNIKAYIFGNNKSFFISKLKKLMKYESFLDLKSLVKKLSLEIKVDKNITHKTILFSPSAASFDNFKNFEKRGEYFNQLIKKYINA